MGKPRRKPGVPPAKTPNEAGPTEIVSPYLYLGPHTATKPSALAAHRLTHVISVGCRPKHHGGDAPAVAYHRLGLSDTPEADLGPQVLLVADMIRHARASGPHARVLVHCVAGVSRSPAMLAYYLMKDEGMSLREALGLLVRARPAVRPNEGFLRQLKELEVQLRGETSLEGIDALPMALAEKKALLGIEDET